MPYLEHQYDQFPVFYFVNNSVISCADSEFTGTTLELNCSLRVGVALESFYCCDYLSGYLPIQFLEGFGCGRGIGDGVGHGRRLQAKIFKQIFVTDSFIL